MSPDAGYEVHWPVVCGRLNVYGATGPPSASTARQALEDMCNIWRWVLEHKLNLTRTDCHQYSTVLVVPDTFSAWEVKEVMNILLRHLEFFSCVVHQESMAAVFAGGSSLACVVNIGAHSTTVCCVDDGKYLRTTIYMNYYSFKYL